MHAHRLSLRIVAASTAAIAAAAIGAAPSFAVRAAPPGERPAFDVRSSDPAKVSGTSAAAREKGEESLGELAKVETDRDTGGVAWLAKVDGFLTGPSSASPESVVLDYLARNAAMFGLDRDDRAKLVQNEDATSPDSITHVGFVQVSDGIPSFHSGIRGHVDAKGRLIAISGGAQPDLEAPSTAPALDADAALAAARADANGAALGAGSRTTSGPEQRTVFTTGERASLVLFPMGDTARLAWQVEVDGAQPFAYTTVVDATSGEILFRAGRTNFVNGGQVFQYYPGAPNGGTPSVVEIDPPGQNWLNDTAGGTQLAGQNAHAYADRNANNVADAGENIPSAGGSWSFAQATFPGASPCPPAGCTWDSTNAATEAVNRPQSVTNLFFHTNKFHDYLRDSPIGFDAASGNFEGADRVLAEGNDGAGMNNANFNTPADGASGRMQMFLWNSRDVTGNDDATIIYHEYGHGLTNRLVGGPTVTGTLSTQQASSMGEGWSDFFGLDYLAFQGLLVDGAGPGDVILGDYPLGGIGIRKQAMDCTLADVGAPECASTGGSGPGGFTYGDIAGLAVPHGVGEAWSQTLWQLRGAIAARDGNPALSGPEHDAVLRIIAGGLRLSPANPTFLDMRDAILQQVVATDPALYQTVWTAFAARGMGANATSPPNGAVAGVVENFDPPSGVRVADTVIDDSFAAGGDGDGQVEPGERFEIRQGLKNIGFAPLSDVTGTLTGVPGVTILRGTSDWPTIAANGAVASNAPAFAARAPESASCTPTPLGLTLDVSTPLGPASIPIPVTSQAPPIDYAGPSATVGLPVGIPDNNGAGVSSDLVIPSGGTITDLNVRIGRLDHSWVGDVRVTLEHVETGTIVVLIDRPGVPASTFGTSVDDLVDTVLDDEAVDPIEDANVAGFTGAWTPNGSLADFDGESLAGTWRLTASDNAAGDTGTLHAWNLNTSPPDCRVSRPLATTGAASAVTPSTAAIAGTAGRGPGAVVTRARVAYGTSAALGSVTPSIPVTTDGASAVQFALAGLAEGTTYHYRVETLRGGTLAVPGETRTFTTGVTPPPPGPGVVPPPPIGGSSTPPTAKDPAKLRVLRAGAKDGKLDVLAEVTKRAKGELKLSFLSGGRTFRFDADIPSSGVVKINRALPSKMRRARSGILEIEYPGTDSVRSDEVRLRAANRKALLKRTVTSLKDGRLKVAGTISSRARGVVRIRHDYVEADGSVKSLDLKAKIAKGKWSVDEKLTGAAATGGQLSIQFTGYLPARMRGEQTAKAVP